MSCCAAIDNMQSDDKKALRKNYHDKKYGLLIHEHNELFGRLILESIRLDRAGRLS